MLLSKFSCVSETIEGRNAFKIEIPSYLEGHHFAIELHKKGDCQVDCNEYRFEFVLGDSFSNEFRAIKEDKFINGFSCLEFVPPLKDTSYVIICYGSKTDTAIKKEAKLTFKASDSSELQRIVLILSESSIKEARNYAEVIVNNILDWLTYSKEVPLEIKRCEVYLSDNNIWQYVNLPYITKRDITIHDVNFIDKVPGILIPFLRLLREATNSNNAFYRLLCLFRIFDDIKKIRTKNNSEVKSKGMYVHREKVRVPNNELTQKGYSKFIDASVEVFINYVRTELRLNIAHLNLDDFFGAILDPALIKNVHKVDEVNAVLLDLVRPVIQNEISFMRNNELSFN